MSRRIHIFGASGAGVTTLGRNLSREFGIPVYDGDNYYWKKTPIPYTVKNDIAERYARLTADMQGRDEWIFSGSFDTWCEPLRPLLTLAVFLYVPAEVRVRRLRAREKAEFGARIEEGGDMASVHEEFIRWTAHYDSGKEPGRSLPRHLDWMKTLHCPIVRLDGEQSEETLVRQVAMYF